MAEKAVTHQEDELLTQSEAGRRMGVTSQTIGLWIRKGLFEAVRMPSGLHKVRASQVDAILESSSLRQNRKPEP